MEENTLEESISRLLASIKESAEYIEFEKQKEILSQDPDLKKRVDAKNYRIQSQCSSDQLFEVVEQMGKESAELRRLPLVNAYLDAEIALCRMIQRIYMELTDGIDFDTPNIS